MKPTINHPWNVSVSEAIQIQNNLRTKLVLDWNLPKIKIVAGVDTGFEGPDNNIARAVVVLLNFDDLSLIDFKIAKRPVEFPYVPGFLSFREGPSILDAFEKLTIEPDLIIFDGHGFAHPRRMGIAAHMGVLLDKPSIGCGKSKLFGTIAVPPLHKGDISDLVYKDDLLGKVVLTKERTNPVIISPGHKVGFDDAVKYVLACTKPKLKLPETTNWAHKIAKGGKLASTPLFT